MDPMTVEGILLFALCAAAVIVAVRWVANRTGLPSAALLTIVGIAYALLPGPNVHLEAEVILTFVIPPLLYSAALDSSLLDIRRHLRTVISLSVLLVLATAMLVGVGFSLFVSGATLAAGVALGAAIAPPDPVAALAVGRRAGLPGNLITLIQGEGLLNDATALTILTVAASAATGDGFSFPHAIGKFLLASVGGLVAGVVVAYAVRALRSFRHDPLSSNTISLVTPFAAYLLAESLHVSGVLAVVVAGLIIGHDAPRYGSGASRLQTGAVWRLIDFVLEGVVFLQLPEVVKGLADYSAGTIAAALAVSVGVTLLLRPLWLVLTQSLPRSLHTRLGAEGDDLPVPDKRLNAKEVTALSWAGTRGVISLAAIFIVHGDVPDLDRERNVARSASVQAAIDRLDEIKLERHDNVEDRAIENMRKQLEVRLERYRRRLDLLEKADSDEMPTSPQYEAALMVRKQVIEAQREELLRRRDSGGLNDEGLRVLERELDHEELLLPDRQARI
jgi:NhaP-type Na+/H+ or K+/H+ antiporter